MLDRDEAGFQQRPRSVQEAPQRQEGQHRRHHVSDAGEVLEELGGLNQRAHRRVGHREEEDRAALE